MSLEKPPPELIARFDSALGPFPDLERRQMFSYPCAFTGGHLIAGLHEHRWFVRREEDARVELPAEDGAEPFAPMPGRSMREYVVLPAGWSNGTIAPWIERAAACTRSLPPKPARQR